MLAHKVNKVGKDLEVLRDRSVPKVIKEMSGLWDHLEGMVKMVLK